MSKEEFAMGNLILALRNGLKFGLVKGCFPMGLELTVIIPMTEQQILEVLEARTDLTPEKRAKLRELMERNGPSEE